MQNHKWAAALNTLISSAKLNANQNTGIKKYENGNLKSCIVERCSKRRYLFKYKQFFTTKVQQGKS